MLVDLMLSFINNSVNIFFLNSLFNKKEKKRISYIFIIILTIESMIINYSKIPVSMILFIPICISFIYSFIYLSGSIYKKIFCVLMCYSINYCVNLFSLYLMVMLNNIFFIASNDLNIYVIYTYEIVKLLMIVMLMSIFSNAYSKKDFGNNLYKSQVWLPVFSLCSVFLFAFLSFPTKIDQNFFATEAILILIILNFSFTLITIKLYSMHDKYTNQELEIKALKQQTEITNFIEHALNETKKINHDLKNNYAILKSLLEHNDLNGAISFLNDINADQHFNLFIYSDNKILNYILNFKIQSNSDINFKVNILNNLNFIKPVDLVTIVGNLLDNAIEATKKTERHDKSIEINIFKKYCFVYIEIINNFEYQPKFEKSRLKSIKNSSLHGLGIEIVESRLNKYNGFFKWKITNNKFIALCTFSIEI